MLKRSREFKVSKENECDKKSANLLLLNLSTVVVVWFRHDVYGL